ncbi:hypothetical protein ACOMHN_039724 [Nucella lapillus]
MDAVETGATTKSAIPSSQITTVEYSPDSNSDVFEIFDWNLTAWSNDSHPWWWGLGEVTSEAGWSERKEGVGDGGGELWREIPLGVVLTFLCLLTTMGNIMVLHAVRTEKRLQSSNRLSTGKQNLCRAPQALRGDSVRYSPHVKGMAVSLQSLPSG